MEKLKSLSEAFGFTPKPETMKSSMDTLAAACVLKTEAILYAILVDTKLPKDAREQKIGQQSKKIAEYAQTFKIDFKRRIQKQIMAASMEKLLSGAGDQ